MSSTTFEDLGMDPASARENAIREAEARLVGFALRDLGNLDHAPGLRPQHFGDGTMRAVYARLLTMRAAGVADVDVVAVAAELAGVVGLPELVQIEHQADGMTPGKAASLAGMVTEGWQARELRRNLAALAFEDMAPAEVIEAARLHVDRIEAAVPGRAAGDSHPLAQFVELAKQTPAVRWIIPGVIEHGVVTISGARGVGKTTALLPLAMVAAGLHAPGDPLAPKPGRWRHVVYIVEDIAQAQRIVSGMVRHGDLGIREEDVRERVHLVEARRLPPADVARVGRLYADRFTRTVNGVAVLPLVVFDTKAATFRLNNENDNSEASEAVAAIKQRFEGLPCWIVGHISKGKNDIDDVKGLSDRGASAFESDAIQNVYLVQDQKTGKRLMLLGGKKRFEPKWTELEVKSRSVEVVAFDEWGDPEMTWLRWGILTPMEQGRTEAREQAQEAAKALCLQAMRQNILDAVEVAWTSGNPISKTGLKSRVPGKGAEVGKQVESLLSEGWLHEVEVPSGQRLNNRKSHFLIRLDTPEHDEFMSSGTVPADKWKVPQSWKKPEIPFVPESEPEQPEN